MELIIFPVPNVLVPIAIMINPLPISMILSDFSLIPGPINIVLYLDTLSRPPSRVVNILGFKLPVDGTGVTGVIEDDPEPVTEPPVIPDPTVRRPQPIWGELINGIYYKDNLDIEDEKMINKKYKVNISYAVDSGKGDTYYDDYQFDLGRPPIQLTHSGIDILNANKNVMEFIVTDREWVLKIQGFDTNRELENNIN